MAEKGMKILNRENTTTIIAHASNQLIGKSTATVLKKILCTEKRRAKIGQYTADETWTELELRKLL